MTRPILGIITNTRLSVFQHNVITGALEIAHQRGYDVVIDAYADDPSDPQPITLDYHQVDGVLAIASAVSPELLREMFEAGTPVSLVSHHVEGLPIPAVITDNTQGITELMRHIVDRCGRRQLVYIGGLSDQRDARERAAAFEREVMRYNLDVPSSHRLQGDFSPEIAARSLRDLLTTKSPFDAVIAADYLMGIAAVDVLREHGFRVPDDISVVGFGDGTEAEQAGLTTVAADVVEQGRRAARQVISQIEGMHIDGVTVLSVQLIIRESCGCPLPAP